MSRLALVAVLLCYFIGTVISEGLPSFITPCRAKDPNLNECALKEGNKVIAVLLKGFPELGLPNLITYKYPDIVYNGTDVKVKYHGGTATGLAGFVLTDIKYDFVNKLVESTNKIPTLELDGTYDIDGKIFDTQIKATGPFKITLENVDYHYKLQYGLYNKEGEEYARAIEQKIRLEPETVRVNFENLFEDIEKTAKFNHQINENKERSVKEIVPTVGVLLKDYMTIYILENMLPRIPYNKIFLQD